MQNNSQFSEKQTTKIARIHELEHFVFKRYELRKNVVSNELEGRTKGSKEDFEPIIEDEIAYHLYSAGFSKFKEELKVMVSHLVQPYDPIQEYFNSLPKWDGETDHIKYLASFLDVEDPKWFLRMFKKWLVRSFIQASGLRPGYFNKQCLTLVGKQNDGKTSFLDFLIPPALKRYSRKGFTFGSKDGLISLTQNFLINLDELASFDKKEINNEFKTVLSESSVKFRALYQPNERAQPRRASFVASTNEFEFLTDPTGNVRWLPFVVRQVQHDNGGPKGYNQKVNIDLVWSQVYALYKSGFEAEMHTDEVHMQEAINKNFVRSTLEMDLIRKHYQPSEKGADHAVFLPVCDIAEELRTWTKYNLNAVLIGKALQSIGFKQHRTATARGYYVLRNTPAPNLTPVTS